MTYDVKIIIKTFYMSGLSFGENLFSIWQAAAEKNTHVLCRQADRQTDNQMDPNAIPSFGEGNQPDGGGAAGHISPRANRTYTGVVNGGMSGSQWQQQPTHISLKYVLQYLEC